jgi:invasion protein IalB
VFGFVLCTAFLTIGVTAESRNDMTEQFKSWTLSCINEPNSQGEAGQRICRVSQVLRHRESGKVVLSVMMWRIQGEQTTHINIMTPFGLNVREQVSMRAQNQLILALPIGTCLPEGCLAQSPIYATLLNQLWKQPEIVVSVPVYKSNQTFAIKLTLDGFQDAYRRMTSLTSVQTD